jgi:hypothetical protein
MVPEGAVAPRVPVPPPPDRVKVPFNASVLWAGVVLFTSFFLVTWLLVGRDPCHGPVCRVALLLVAVALLVEPFLVLIVLSVRAADVTGRVSFPVRSILSIVVSACIWSGELLGELANGTASGSVLTLFILVPVAAAFTWPFAFLVTTLTSWTLEARGAGRRRRSPTPPRPDH